MGCGCSGNAVDKDLRHMSELARKAALMQGRDYAVVRNAGGGYRLVPADEVAEADLCRVAEYRSRW